MIQSADLNFEALCFLRLSYVSMGGAAGAFDVTSSAPSLRIPTAESCSRDRLSCSFDAVCRFLPLPVASFFLDSTVFPPFTIAKLCIPISAKVEKRAVDGRDMGRDSGPEARATLALSIEPSVPGRVLLAIAPTSDSVRLPREGTVTCPKSASEYRRWSGNGIGGERKTASAGFTRLALGFLSSSASTKRGDVGRESDSSSMRKGGVIGRMLSEGLKGEGSMTTGWLKSSFGFSCSPGSTIGM